MKRKKCIFLIARLESISSWHRADALVARPRNLLALRQTDAGNGRLNFKIAAESHQSPTPVTNSSIWTNTSLNEQSRAACDVGDLVNSKVLAFLPCDMDAPEKEIEPEACRREKPTPVAPGVGEWKSSGSSKPEERSKAVEQQRARQAKQSSALQLGLPGVSFSTIPHDLVYAPMLTLTNAEDKPSRHIPCHENGKNVFHDTCPDLQIVRNYLSDKLS